MAAHPSNQFANQTANQHADRVQAAIASGRAANSALIASWRRSLGLHHLDPTEKKPPQRLTEAELRHARDKIAPVGL